MNGAGSVRALSVGVWLTIDSTLDNAVANLIGGGRALEDPEVTRARGLRERGWVVNRDHPERGLGPVGWPPRESRFDITLSDDDVRYLIGLIAQGMRITERVLTSAVTPSIRQTQADSLALMEEAVDALGYLRAGT